MDYDRLATAIAKLLSPAKLGQATSLIRTTKVRAATGGAITTTTTTLPVNLAVTSDETTFADGKPIRTIVGYLSGAEPTVGDQVVLPDGNHRVEKVAPIQPALILIAHQVTLS